MTSHREDRIWSGGEKFGQSVFPWAGLYFVRDEVEVNRYALLTFMNSSLLTTDLIRRELTGICLMVMQNRLVLDQLTAAQGGVCTICGDTCCTFTPANDTDGGAIAKALSDLTLLRDGLKADTQGASSWLPYWMTGWQRTLISFLIPVVFVIGVLILLACCIVPLVKVLIKKIIGNVMGLYLTVPVPDDTYFPSHPPFQECTNSEMIVLSEYEEMTALPDYQNDSKEYDDAVSETVVAGQFDDIESVD